MSASSTGRTGQARGFPYGLLGARSASSRRSLRRSRRMNRQSSRHEGDSVVLCRALASGLFAPRQDMPPRQPVIWPRNRRQHSRSRARRSEDDEPGPESTHGFPDLHRDIKQKKTNDDGLKYDVMRMRPEVIKLLGDRLVGSLTSSARWSIELDQSSRPSRLHSRRKARAERRESKWASGSVNNAWK